MLQSGTNNLGWSTAYIHDRRSMLENMQVTFIENSIRHFRNAHIIFFLLPKTLQEHCFLLGRL